MWINWKNRAIFLYKSHTFLFYVLVFFTLLIFMFVAQLLYIKLSTGIQKASIEHSRSLEKTRRQEQYDLLVQKQSQPKDRKQGSEVQGKVVFEDQTINIVLVKPSKVSDSQITPLVSQLKKGSQSKFQTCYLGRCSENISLNFIPSYYRAQAEKNGYRNFKGAIKILGLYESEELNQVGDFAYVWGKDPFGLAKLEEKFENILKENNLNKEGYYVFLYFDDTYSQGDNSSTYSFYENKKFRSFADESKKRAYVNVYNFSPFFSEVTTEVATHEILHLFGASDKYVESYEDSRYCEKNGRGDPDKKPVLPQKTADIMCFFIEKNSSDWERGDLIDGTLTINKYTAEEVGWN